MTLQSFLWYWCTVTLWAQFFCSVFLFYELQLRQHRTLLCVTSVTSAFLFRRVYCKENTTVADVVYLFKLVQSWTWMLFTMVHLHVHMCHIFKGNLASCIIIIFLIFVYNSYKVTFLLHVTVLKTAVYIIWRAVHSWNQSTSWETYHSGCHRFFPGLNGDKVISRSVLDIILQV